MWTDYKRLVGYHWDFFIKWWWVYLIFWIGIILISLVKHWYNG